MKDFILGLLHGKTLEKQAPPDLTEDVAKCPSSRVHGRCREGKEHLLGKDPGRAMHSYEHASLAWQ